MIKNIKTESVIKAAMYIQDNGINTVRKICEVESITYNRKFAEGLTLLNKYPSESEGKDLDLLDMNLGHILRAFSSTLQENKKLKESTFNIKSSLEYKRGWNAAYNQIRNVLFDTKTPTPKPMI
tara:strand:+ start:416 stop:787 length:372 start_codon:yes stop_codon:yes gene_type:complete